MNHLVPRPASGTTRPGCFYSNIKIKIELEIFPKYFIVNFESTISIASAVTHLGARSNCLNPVFNSRGYFGKYIWVTGKAVDSKNCVPLETEINC